MRRVAEALIDQPLQPGVFIPVELAPKSPLAHSERACRSVDSDDCSAGPRKPHALIKNECISQVELIIMYFPSISR